MKYYLLINNIFVSEKYETKEEAEKEAEKIKNKSDIIVIKECEDDFSDMTDNEKNAKTLCEAIKKLAENPDALSNFESYLGNSFDTWIKKYASTPEGMSREFKSFADMYDEEE